MAKGPRTIVTQGRLRTRRGHDNAKRNAPLHEIGYELHGEATALPPVLLFRPLGGTVDLWGEFRSTLAATFQVISFDLPGTGASANASDWHNTTKDFARDGLDLLNHLAVPRAQVFGLSLGGMAATWLAISAPERIAKLCLASTPARGLDLSYAGLRRELSLARCFLRHDRDVESCLARRILSSRFRCEHPAEVERIVRTVHAQPTPRRVLLEHALAGFRHDVRRSLHRVEAETLVLAGKDDHLLSPSWSQALAARIDRAAFEIVEHSGHDLSLEKPRETATRVAEFFREPL
jgi:3-oxoadipate enol-lactonase